MADDQDWSKKLSKPRYVVKGPPRKAPDPGGPENNWRAEELGSKIQRRLQPTPSGMKPQPARQQKYQPPAPKPQQQAQQQKYQPNVSGQLIARPPGIRYQQNHGPGPADRMLQQQTGQTIRQRQGHRMKRT